MTDFLQITQIMDASFLPLMGTVSLLFAKLTSGAMARRMEMNFYVFLVVVTLITARTVILCEDTWLIHTVTLAVMIIGGLAFPGQSADFDEAVPTVEVG